MSDNVATQAAAAAPLVSVIVPLFNASSTILATLDSVLATGWPSLEVLVVDDASSDDGAERVRLYAAAQSAMQVRLIRHADGGNHGPAASRNLGIAESTGEFICFLDADDQFLPHRLHEAVATLLASPQIEAVYGTYQYHFPAGVESCRDVAPEHLGDNRFPLADPSIPPLYVLLAGKAGEHTSTVTLRRRCAVELGGFPALQYGEDNAFWIRLFATRSVRRLPGKPVSLYLIHGDSWCSQAGASDRFAFGPALARIDALRWLSGRPLADGFRARIRADLVAKLINRYHDTVGRGRSSQHYMRRLMLDAISVAPQALLNHRFIAVLMRLLLNLHPRIEARHS